MGNTTLGSSTLPQEALTGFLGFNQEVRDTGQGLVLPVPIAHVESGSLTGNSSSYPAGLGARFRQAVRNRTFSIQISYRDCLHTIRLLSGRASRSWFLFYGTFVLSKNFKKKLLGRRCREERAEQEGKLATCRSLMLARGPCSTEPGQTPQAFTSSRMTVFRAKVAVPLAGLNLTEGIEA